MDSHRPPPLESLVASLEPDGRSVEAELAEMETAARQFLLARGYLTDAEGRGLGDRCAAEAEDPNERDADRVLATARLLRLALAEEPASARLVAFLALRLAQAYLRPGIRPWAAYASAGYISREGAREGARRHAVPAAVVARWRAEHARLLADNPLLSKRRAAEIIACRIGGASVRTIRKKLGRPGQRPTALG